MRTFIFRYSLIMRTFILPRNDAGHNTKMTEPQLTRSSFYPKLNCISNSMFQAVQKQAYNGRLINNIQNLKSAKYPSCYRFLSYVDKYLCVQTACDSNGWILGYTVHPGNQHDSRTFIDIYNKILKFHPEKLGMDSGYRTPAIARRTIEDGIEPIMPYKRPQTKEGFFKKYEYAYDEYYDCYICPENKILSYSTTNRDGYREYKSNCNDCMNCSSRYRCTESKNFEKIVTRHVWEDYMELSEDIRCNPENQKTYKLRKETIERLFGTAKEQHGFRYTQQVGKARMEMKVGLTYACMNLKKLANLLALREEKASAKHLLSTLLSNICKTSYKKEKWCLSC